MIKQTINPDDDLDAFLLLSSVDVTLGEAYEESSRPALTYAAPIPVTLYTSGDTSPEGLPPITDEAVRILPLRLPAMYVPHESEGRELTEDAVSPRLPSRGQAAGETLVFSSFTRFRATSVSDLLNKSSWASGTLFSKKKEMSQDFVPTAPEVAEMLEALGVKPPSEAKLSDRRRYGAREAKSVLPPPLPVFKSPISVARREQTLADLHPLSGPTISRDALTAVETAVMPPPLSRHTTDRIASGASENSVGRRETIALPASQKRLGLFRGSPPPATDTRQNSTPSTESHGDLLRRAEERMRQMQQAIDSGDRQASENESKVEDVSLEASRLEQALADAEHKAREQAKTTDSGERQMTTDHKGLGRVEQPAKEQIAQVLREASGKIAQEAARQAETRVTDRLRGEFERQNRDTTQRTLKVLTNAQKEAQDRFLNS